MIPRLKELFYKEIQSSLKSQFGYNDTEWNFIWSTMIQDGAWNVPNIKDSFGNILKQNWAPEILIKYIAHDLRCHIIVFNLQLGKVQFCSGNHVKDGNAAFDLLFCYIVQVLTFSQYFKRIMSTSFNMQNI